ncbi:hypothetical protein NIES4071_60540 [Calothrix sp. NIES-4071]|nr:hypothetical protein NIES4071_60540 [Calothrix sp. NIES-4071]BAZ60361.1 hypothetical protein NIES4105_60490 [Calothrix sp. NIES-4105]
MDSAQAYQKCLKRLTWATESLKLDIPQSELEHITDLIVQPMTGPWRFFHTPKHIFEVGGSKDPIEILAALFHDLVYVQVDWSINFNVGYYLSPFAKEINGRLAIRSQSDLPVDKTFGIVASVFGFVPGQVLNPYTGQNEFLSALVAAKVLEPFVLAPLLMQIVACIEATIPFRPTSEQGLTASEQLLERLNLTNEKFHLLLTDTELYETIKRGVRVANRDVCSFAHPSAARFLANTWNLLPETNHNLSVSGAYTVADYRIAIQKMEGFMASLKPEVVFRSFQEEPRRHTYNIFEYYAKRNIEIAQLYLKSKLVTIALIEAISFVIGLDIPLVIMMGEMPLRGFTFMRLEHFLPEVANPYEPKTHIEQEVWNILKYGRAKSNYNDLQHSPIAIFIVKLIGFDGIKNQCDLAKQFFVGNISNEEFINSFQNALPEKLIRALQDLFESRKIAVSHCYKFTSNQKSQHH